MVKGGGEGKDERALRKEKWNCGERHECDVVGDTWCVVIGLYFVKAIFL